MLQRLSIRRIFADDIELAIAREACIAQIPGCDDVGVVDQEEFGVDEVVELGIVVGDEHSRALQGLESLTVDARRSEDIFLQNHPYGHPAFLCVRKRFDDAFLRKYVHLDGDLFPGSLDHGDDPVEHFFVRSREDLDLPRFDFLDRKCRKILFDGLFLFGELRFLLVKLPVLVGGAGGEEEEGEEKGDDFFGHAVKKRT